MEITNLASETKNANSTYKLTINNLDAGFHYKHALKDINLGIEKIL